MTDIYRDKKRIRAWRVPESFTPLDLPEWLVASTRVKLLDDQLLCERNPWVADSEEPEWQIAHPGEWIVRTNDVLCTIDEYTFVFPHELFTENYEPDEASSELEHAKRCIQALRTFSNVTDAQFEMVCGVPLSSKRIP